MDLSQQDGVERQAADVSNSSVSRQQDEPPDMRTELSRTKAIHQLGERTKYGDQDLFEFLFPDQKSASSRADSTSAGADGPVYWLPIEELVARIVQATTDRDIERRRAALRWIGELADRHRTGEAHPDFLFSLGLEQRQQIVDTLRQVLDNDEDPESVASAVDAGREFEMFDGVDGVSRLIDYIESSAESHVTARPGFITALDDAGPDAASAAVPVLVGLLDDSEREVRLQVVKTLGWLRVEARATVADLVQIAVLAGADEELGMAAVRSLLQINPEGDRILEQQLTVADKTTLAGLLRRAAEDADLQESAGELRRSIEDESMAVSSQTPKQVQTIGKWSELGIGITDDGQYLAFIPCPDAGAKVRKSDGVAVSLRGKRWPPLLDELSKSEYGNTVSKRTIGSLWQLTPSINDDPDENDDEDEDGIKRKLPKRSLKQTEFPSRVVTGITSDLNRKLKSQIQVADDDTAAISVCGDTITSAFCVRHLFVDHRRHYYFGKPDGAD